MIGLPRGAEFVRCALQVNPHHYSASYRGTPNDGDAKAHASRLIERASELEIGVLAITDHNSVRDIGWFREAAIDSPVTVLPGFEIESMDGVHVLCIYDVDTEVRQLERFLGEFGIRATKPLAGRCSRDFVSILTMVPDQGGVTIAAHATGRKGLFRALEGSARVLAWRSEDLLAIQIPSSIDKLAEGDRSIVRNTAPEYARSYPASKQQSIAVVNAKDVIEADDLTELGATTLIKFSGQPSAEGLRQAFLDPDSRIRLNTDAMPGDHSELMAIAWEGGGFLDGSAIRFNPDLNVLIGGRGTGKSTVIESIRYALDLDPLGDEARKTHQDIVRNVLRSGTKVILLVRSVYPSERIYRIERTVSNPAIVRNRHGETLGLLPKDALPTAEVYCQHEISELTRNRPKLTHLLRRFVRNDRDADTRLARILRGLHETRTSFLNAQSEIDAIEDQISTLPQLEEMLERFQEAGLEERLRDRSLMVREFQIVGSIAERLRPLRDSAKALQQELPLDRTFLAARTLDQLPGSAILRGANEVLQELSNTLEAATRHIERAFETADKQLAVVVSEWEQHKSKIDSEYHRILRELQASEIDGEEFIRLQTNIEDLRKLKDHKRRLIELRSETHRHRRSLLAEWEDAKAERFRGYRRAAEEVSEQLRGFVRVMVTDAGDRRPLTELLRDEVAGRLTEAIEKLESIDQLSLPDFVASCRKGAAELKEQYGFTAKQAGNLADAGEGTFMKIEELHLPMTTELFLNVSGNQCKANWQSLERLSKGQKATAVLLLLLLGSDGPLVIDQPEDDLDNRFISEVMVQRIRDSKRRRQLVFSTHNANIPVLGDAELILGLDAHGDAHESASAGHAIVDPQRMGSIDSSPVRTLVKEVLEGGKDAFERRRRKYGF